MTRRLLLVGALPPPPGGIAIHLRELERAFSARGALVEAIDPRRDGPDGTDGRPRLLARFARATFSGELVHLHACGHNRNSWLLAWAAGLCQHAIVTIHSGLAPSFMRSHQMLVKKGCERIKCLVAVNPEIAEALTAAGVSPARIEVLPAFTSSSLSFRLAPPGLAQARRRHPQLLACAVVADQPEYGTDLMLDAMMRVHQIAPAAGLLLYGPGTASPALAACVRARGLGRVVHLLGTVARERALALVAAADLFVRPSRADGDALSIREALALGRRVVASDVVARPRGVVQFASGSPAACAEAIFHALGNRGAPCETAAASPPDCIAALTRIYRRAGLLIAPETTGTAFAKLGG